VNKKGLVLTIEKDNGEIIEIPCENPFILKTKLMEVSKIFTTASLESAIINLTAEIAKINEDMPRPGREICKKCARENCFWRDIENPITEKCIGFMRK